MEPIALVDVLAIAAAAMGDLLVVITLSFSFLGLVPGLFGRFDDRNLAGCWMGALGGIAFLAGVLLTDEPINQIGFVFSMSRGLYAVGVILSVIFVVATTVLFVVAPRPRLR